MTVGDPVDDRTAESGDHPDDDADDGAANAEPGIGKPVADAAHPAAAKYRTLRDGAVLAQQGDDLGNCEDPEADDHEFQPVDQVGQVVAGHPELAGRVSFADRADHHAEAGGHDSLQGHATGKNADHGKAEHRDHQEFGRPELEHDRSCDKDEERQERRADQAAEKR